MRGLRFNLYPVFEGEPHIVLAVNRHEIHHGVPGCLVKIIDLYPALDFRFYIFIPGNKLFQFII